MEACARVFYDGDCDRCKRLVAWLASKDGAGKLEAIPYQELPNGPLRHACQKAVHLTTSSGKLLSGAAACAEALDLVGYRLAARALRQGPVLRFAERIYDWFAAHRCRCESGCKIST